MGEREEKDDECSRSAHRSPTDLRKSRPLSRPRIMYNQDRNPEDCSISSVSQSTLSTPGVRGDRIRECPILGR